MTFFWVNRRQVASLQKDVSQTGANPATQDSEPSIPKQGQWDDTHEPTTGPEEDLVGAVAGSGQAVQPTRVRAKSRVVIDVGEPPEHLRCMISESGVLTPDKPRLQSKWYQSTRSTLWYGWTRGMYSNRNARH